MNAEASWIYPDGQDFYAPGDTWQLVLTLPPAETRQASDPLPNPLPFRLMPPEE